VICKKVPLDSVGNGCACHAPITGDDWFPRSEIEESFNNLKAKILQKLGVDIEELFSDIQGTSFTRFNIPIWNFTGSQGLNVFGSHVRDIVFDVEQIAYDHSDIVLLIRRLALGILFLALIRVVLVTLRQY